MEYLEGGNVEKLKPEDMKKLESLFARIHKQEKHEVVHALDVIKQLVLELGFERDFVDNLAVSRGGFALYLIYWWKEAYPAWLSRKFPDRVSLSSGYNECLFSLINSIAAMKLRSGL